MCTILGFEDNHFSLTRSCGAGKLSSPEILKLIANNHLCFTCTQAHGKGYRCKTTFFNGAPKVCPKGCSEKGIPVHRHACMHSNQALFVSVSKVSTNKSVPLLETILLGNRIQVANLASFLGQPSQPSLSQCTPLGVHHKSR